MDETDVEFAGGAAKGKNASRPRFTETPRYYLVTAQYINDTYYGAETIIEGEGIVPNEGMEPKNQSAQDAFDAWFESLPAPPQRHEDFIMNAMMNRPRHEIPAPVKAARRKPGRIHGKESTPNAKITVVADETVAKVPKKQMGTIVHEVPTPGSI